MMTSPVIRSIIIASAACMPTSLGAQEQWHTVYNSGAEIAQVETSTVQGSALVFEVTMRWDYSGTARTAINFVIQRQVIDCESFRLRGIGPPKRSWLPDLATASVDTSWVAYSHGSLGRLIIEGACRWLTAFQE